MIQYQIAVKKILLSLVLFCMMSNAALGMIPTSCGGCISSNFTDATTACCGQDEQTSSACGVEERNLNGCQLCFHADPPDSQLETVVHLNIENEMRLDTEYRPIFSGEIPPSFSFTSFSHVSIFETSCHLLHLESIRLLI